MANSTERTTGSSARKEGDGPKRLAETMGTEMATVYIGLKRKTYILHKNLLINESDYFKAAFSGRFKEAASAEIHMEDVDAGGFEILIGWMYSGVVPDQSRDDTAFSALDSRFNNLIEFYILADKILLSAQVKIDVLDKLRKMFLLPIEGKGKFSFLNNTAVGNALSRLGDECPLRILILDMVAFIFMTLERSDGWIERLMTHLKVTDTMTLMRSMRSLARLERLGLFKKANAMFEPEKSVVDIKRYQVGFLKVAQKQVPVSNSVPMAVLF